MTRPSQLSPLESVDVRAPSTRNFARAKARADLSPLRRQEAGGNQGPPGPREARKVAGERKQLGAQKIHKHEIEEWSHDRLDWPDKDLELPVASVGPRIRRGRLCRQRVKIKAHCRSRAEHERRERENARAAANVEGARAIDSVFPECLQELKRESRGIVAAGSECLAGLDHDARLPGAGRKACEGRPHHESRGDLDGLETRAPGD